MKILPITLAATFLATPALAHLTGEAHTHPHLMDGMLMILNLAGLAGVSVLAIFGLRRAGLKSADPKRIRARRRK